MIKAKGGKVIKKDLKKALRETRKEQKRVINTSAMLFKKKQAPAIVESDWNLKKASIKRRLRVTKATTSNLNAVVECDRTLPNAVSFRGTRETKKGLSVSYRKGKKTLIPKAFLTSVKYGAPGEEKTVKIAVIRKERGFTSKRKWKKGQGKYFPREYRYKLEAVRGPSVGRMLEDAERKRDEAIIPTLQKESDEAWKKLLNI